MSAIQSQVRTARFRLNLNVFFDRAAWAILLAAMIWSLVWVAERAFVFGLPLWPSVWGAAALAGLLAIGGTFLARVNELNAAVAIDVAAGLKERVSTAFLIARDSDPFAIAAVRDAEKTAGRLHVASHVPIKSPPMLPWSGAMLAVAGLLFAFMPQLNLLAGEKKQDDASAKKLAAAEKVELKQAFDEQLNKVRKLVDENSALKDLKDDLKSLDIVDQPTAKPEDVRRDVVKKIDKIAEQLSEKRDETPFKALEELKRQMGKIEPQQGKDSTSKLSQALAKGDMAESKKALGDLKKELEEAANKSDPETKQKLENMAAKLDELSKQLEKLGDDKKLEKELENKAGMSPEAVKKMMDELNKMDPKALEKELQKRLGESGMTQKQVQELAKKLAQNQEAKKAAQELAKKMSQAAKACQNAGQNSGEKGQQQGAAQAAAAMAEASDQLSDMEMSEQAMNELDAQLSELNDLREGTCKNRGNCPGDKKSDEIGDQGPQEGYGYGSRIGKEAGAHKYKAQKANVRTQSGQIIGQMLIDGPQIKGEAQAEVTSAVNSAVRDATDAIEHDRVPRQYHEVVKKYFEGLAGLGGGVLPKPAEKPGAEAATEKTAEPKGE